MAQETKAFRQEIVSGEILAIDPKYISQEMPIRQPAPTSQQNKIAIVDIQGCLEHHSNFMFDSYEDILARTHEAFCNSSVAAVILKIDSPGGDASSCIETYNALHKMSQKYNKPLYAYVNEMAASAAYALACAAEEIWTPPSGVLGSIGVIATMVDRTEHNKQKGIKVQLITSGTHKADGHPDQEMSDSAIQEQQHKVDVLAQQFFAVVAESRHLSIGKIQKLNAATYLGQEAVNNQLADGVASWNEFVKLIKLNLDSSQQISHINKDNKNNLSQSLVNSISLEKDLEMKLVYTQALAAVKDAKTEAEKAKALAALEKLLTSKKSKSKKMDDAEDEEDSEDEEDEEDSEDKDDDKDKDDDEDDDDSKDTTSTGADDDKEEEKALLHSKTGLYTYDRLYRLVKQVTKKTNVREAFGALSAIQNKIAASEKVAQKVAKLENESQKAKVDDMLSKARRAGKLTKTTAASLRVKGMKDVRWLKGYLATLPALVSTLDDGVKLSAEQIAADPLSALTLDQRKMVEMGAQLSGKSLADEAKAILQTLNKETPKF